ncbi:MAG: ABC transporter ATP-binding protein [Bacillota bacterium]
MENLSLEIRELSKMYKLYRRPLDKVLDAFGLNKILFWRTKYYREFWALKGINLEVKRGERLGIIGRNGAGKSTMLKIISGNIDPTEGEIKVNGRIQALMELGTGFHPEFTGRQNIRASLAYQGLDMKKIQAMEEEIIDFSELEEFIDQPIKTYSAGMYARLAFTVATAIEPEILIIDEVLGAGDAYFAGKCVERMKKLTEESGATVLFVSHDLSSVQQLCNRVIWLDRGRIKEEGDPLSVIKAYMVEVRKEEELRLKARELRVNKRNAQTINPLGDMYEPLLFHLVTDSPHPRKKHWIFRISLKVGGEMLGTINVGDAMDNSSEYLHYIIDDAKFMDWSSPVKHNGLLCRMYMNCGGAYRHAPFIFSVPKSMMNENIDFVVEIEHNTCEEEPVYVELYDKEKYRRLGQLAYSEKTDISVSTFKFSMAEYTRQAEQEVGLEQDFSCKKEPFTSRMYIESSYGSREMCIDKFETLNISGEPCKIFVSNGTMVGRFHYRAFKKIVNPVFVICIYRTDGMCVTQLMMEAKDLGLDYCEGMGTVDVVLKPLLLGKGSYVASVGLFKYCNFMDANENPSYHVIDRGIYFKIVQPDDIIKDLGLIIHPAQWRIINA